MPQIAAALTMVRDDAWFLQKWVDHYGGLFGRENLYVVNHGRGAEVARVAQGCNIIGIPGDPEPNFDLIRWRFLNSQIQALRQYYTHVICGDVDELVVRDPASGGTLRDWLAGQPGDQVITPLGLEVCHRRADEPAEITGPVLGPRRFVRLTGDYSKPCIVSSGAWLSRGGHYAGSDRLHLPDDLYLFHLKTCDFTHYAATMDRRNAVAASSHAEGERAFGGMGRHWFAAHREDERIFGRFEEMRLAPGFDFDAARAGMRASWQPRGKSFWQFTPPDDGLLYEVPERFFGLI